jgi:hypothetical protein
MPIIAVTAPGPAARAEDETAYPFVEGVPT